MNVPAPGFVPVPGPEAMRLISAALLSAGLCLAAAGVPLRSRGCVLLGGAGMAGGGVLRREKRKRKGKERAGRGFGS